MEDDKFKDLLEDEELTALRLAALATKRKEQYLNNSESANALPINSIVTAPTTASEQVCNQIPFLQSDRSAHNSYAWRKQNQSSRRRGGSFPKNNHRSNLIVINPVTLNDGKDSDEKVPALILPQHKWCNSGNEESMSPKALRRTGPTRFNRHLSDSESSDESDYEPSDNDSGSNETILQDEPPEHFSHLSPGCDNLSDSVEKSRRLSFQSLDSEMKPDTFDKNEATSVYKSLKNSLYSDTKQDKYAVEQHLNDRALNTSDESKYTNCNTGLSYATKATDLSEELIFKQGNRSLGKGESYSDKVNASVNKSSDTIEMWQSMDINSSNAYYSKDTKDSQNFRMNEENQKDYTSKRESFQTFTDICKSKTSVWQHGEGLETDSSLYPMKNSCISTDSRTYSDTSAKPCYLSENDLRFELKKRMQELKSKPVCIETNERTENRTYSQYSNSWDRNRQRYSHKDEVNLSSTNSFDEKRESLFREDNRMNQTFNKESDDAEHASNFRQQRSSRSISQERGTHGNFSSKDKSRFEYSSDAKRSRYNRSSSLDRSRNVHSSNQIRRSERSSSRDRKRCERSSSRDRKRCERSSSYDKIKHDSNKSESNLSPSGNKFGHLYRHHKSIDDKNVTKERKDWYKSSPKVQSELSSNQGINKGDHSSSSESKHGSSSQDRNKFSFGNSRNKQEYNADNDAHCTQNHQKSHENNLSKGRTRHLPSSRHDRNRHERSSSHDRSHHNSSHSSDSRSERSSSQEKSRYSSSWEGSKDRHSSSESENRYKCNSRSTFNASKFISNLPKNRHDITINQKKIMKEDESGQNLAQESSTVENKNLKCTQNSEKMKEGGLGKISTKYPSKSIQQNRLERSHSKEKIEANRKSLPKYSKKKDYKKRWSRSSSSDSYSSSYSSSSSHKSRPKIRSVPSVIKPVLMKTETGKGNPSENKSVGKSTNLVTPQSSVHSFSIKRRNLDNTESNKPSNIKPGHMDGDSKVSENKRVPVHMRLGAFPRKRVIQMPKDVEAAFVNSSSSDDENVNTKCKRQNIRIVTDMCDAKNKVDLIQQKYSSDDKPAKRSSPDTCKEKFKRMKAQR